MEKQFTQKQIANWRRVRQNIESELNKLNKLEAKINELQIEAETSRNIINTSEQAVKLATGGYTSQEIFEKVVTDTGTVGPNGYPIRKTTYVLKYPDTILPPTIEQTPEEEFYADMTEIAANYNYIENNTSDNE